MKTEYTHTLRPGTILEERYRIERVIGEGGFGITYEAVNEKIEMTVAIKEFYCRDYTRRNVEESNDIEITAATEENFEKVKKRFLQEAKILSGFNHESSIVKILDYFEENGTAYIVMDYLYGTPLDQYIKEHGTMLWREALQKFRPLVETLERVHNRGVIHRDISPSNIMVLENGSFCLLDFGSAKDRFREEGEKVSTVFSKQGYTPIEQYAGNKQLGAWTDVYALTAVLYECLTGTHPPDSLQRTIYDEYETLREQDIEVPPELDVLLQKGLAVRADERYANMGDLLHVMNNLLTGKGHKKGKWICLAGLFALLACIVCGVVYYHTYKEQIYFNFEETESFCFVRDKDTYIDDFDNGFQKIEDRIKVLAGDKPYIWEKGEDEFRGILPLSCFGSEDPREIIRDLIARPCKWTICGVEIDPRYIANIGFEDQEKRELEIVLSERTPKEVINDLKDLCADKAELSVDYGYRNNLSLDGKMNSPLNYTWNLQEKWENARIRDLFLHDISEDALSLSLDVHTQIQVAWEMKKVGTDYGKSQCEPEELDDYTVTLEYWQRYDERTEGQISDCIRSLKARLDLLNIPYAVGREKNHSQRMILRVNQQDYNEDLFWLLLRNRTDLAIEDAWGAEIHTNFVDLKSDFESAVSKYDKLVINIPTEDESVSKEIRKWVENMEKKKIDHYYLVANGIRILKGSRDEGSSNLDQLKNGKFTFSSMCMENEKLDGENAKIVKLLNEIMENQYNVIDGRELFAWQFSDREFPVAKVPEKVNKKYCFSEKEEGEIIDKIKALSDEYEVKSYTDYEMGERDLRIMLSNEIYSESILDNEIVLAQICRIMAECDLEHKAVWSEIVIGIKSRYKKGNYAAKLMFRHPFYDESQKTPYYITVVAFEKEEGKWIKKIYNKMKSDDRFKAYKIEFADYSKD